MVQGFQAKARQRQNENYPKNSDGFFKCHSSHKGWSAKQIQTVLKESKTMLGTDKI